MKYEYVKETAVLDPNSARIQPFYYHPNQLEIG